MKKRIEMYGVRMESGGIIAYPRRSDAEFHWPTCPVIVLVEAAPHQRLKDAVVRAAKREHSACGGASDFDPVCQPTRALLAAEKKGKR